MGTVHRYTGGVPTISFMITVAMLFR
jgi:hypothetical protein